MASAISSSPFVSDHHHTRSLEHRRDCRSCHAPYSRASDPRINPLCDHASNSSSAAISPENLRPGPSSQQEPSKSTPSATSAVDTNLSGSIKVSPEFQKQGEDTIHEILDRLQKQQNELGSIPNISEPQDMQRSVHTQKLNPELLKTINPHTMRQHHGDANLRHEE